MRNNAFAIVGPPADTENLYDLAEYYKKSELNFNSDVTLLKLFEWMPAFKGTEFKHVRSKAGADASGFNVLCTVLPEMVATVSPDADIKEIAREKVWDACHLSAKLGAGIAALGGFSSISVVGEEEEIARETGIAITTGNTYTAWLTVKGVEIAASIIGINLSKATMTVIGASGDIGRGTCAFFSRRVRKLFLSARNMDRLEKFRKQLQNTATASIHIASDVESAVAASHIVVTAAISHRPIVTAEHVSPGKVICDVGYPKNVSSELAARDDLLVFEGGLTSMPFPLNFGYKSTLPSHDVLWGCSAEGVILALERRFENYSAGRGNISIEKMLEIGKIAEKHGFSPALFYSGNKLLNIEKIANIRKHIDPEVAV